MLGNQATSVRHGRGRGSRLDRRSMRGVGILEVMVSVLILAVGLLGVAAMQAIALRGGQSSLESTQAVIQTNAILEVIRANRDDAATFNTAGMRCAAGVGNPLLEQWLVDLKATVGTAGDATTCGQIVGCPGACVITVRWNDQRAGGQASRQIVTGTQI